MNNTGTHKPGRQIENLIASGVIKIRLLANVGELDQYADYIEKLLAAAGLKILETSPVKPSDNPSLDRKYITVDAKEAVDGQN